MRERSLGFSIAVAIFALDQLTKWLVSGPMHLKAVGQVYLLPFFNLTWTENNGISLGLLNASTETGRWLLVTVPATGGVRLKSGGMTSGALRATANSSGLRERVLLQPATATAATITRDRDLRILDGLLGFLFATHQERAH
jgi:hypothetical protein